MAYLFISPDFQYQLSVDLAKLVLASDFRPDCVISVLRGGAVPGLIMHEMFKRSGVDVPFDFVSAKSYDEMKKIEDLEIRGLTEVVVRDKKVLLVDDLWDTGDTLWGLATKMRAQKYRSLEVATLYFKPDKNKHAPAAPDYYLEELAADTWVVFPHELTDISADALKGHPLFPYL